MKQAIERDTFEIKIKYVHVCVFIRATSYSQCIRSDEFTSKLVHRDLVTPAISDVKIKLNAS